MTNCAESADVPPRLDLDGEYMARAKDEVDVALEAWARWARSAFDGIGWPAVSMIARIIKYGVRGAAHQAGLKALEIDEVCEMVDRALLRLDEDERAVVVRQYFYHETLAATAKSCHIGYERARKLFVRGRRSVADYLEGAKLRYA